MDDAGAQASVLRELDGNWLECADSQGVFYYNSVTQQSVDTLPAELSGAPQGGAQPQYQGPMHEPAAPQPAAETGASQVLRELGGGWLECVDAQGVFYFNQKTQQTSDTLPAELQEPPQQQQARSITPSYTPAEPMHQPHHYSQASGAAPNVKKVEAKILSQSYIPPAAGFSGQQPINDPGQQQFTAAGGIQTQMSQPHTQSVRDVHAQARPLQQIHPTQVYTSQPSYNGAPSLACSQMPCAHNFNKPPESEEAYRLRRSQEEDAIFFKKMQDIENQKQALEMQFQSQVQQLKGSTGQSQPQMAEPVQYVQQPTQPSQYSHSLPPQHVQPQMQQHMAPSTQLPPQHVQHYQQQLPPQHPQMQHEMMLRAQQQQQHQQQQQQQMPQQSQYMAPHSHMQTLEPMYQPQYMPQHQQYLTAPTQHPPYMQAQHQQYMAH